MTEVALEAVKILDRTESIAANVDPMGREWQIKNIRGSSLLKAEPEPFRKDFICPTEFQGSWTSTSQLQEQIQIWLNRVWDASELLTTKQERKTQAKKEAKSKSQLKRIEVQQAEK